MVDNFEEKSGLITSTTSWGKWGQTIEDVILIVDVPEGTIPKSINCVVKSKSISFSVKDSVHFQVHDLGPNFIKSDFDPYRFD